DCFMSGAHRISVVTPTFCRPTEVAELLENLCHQTLLPAEVILIDGARPEEKETEEIVRGLAEKLPFACRYSRHARGTAIQRNAGIESVSGNFIAFIDDDVRLEKTFFEILVEAFERDERHQVGGIVGYRRNQHFNANERLRWKWYRRLRLLTTYEPGRYD